MLLSSSSVPSSSFTPEGNVNFDMPTTLTLSPTRNFLCLAKTSYTCRMNDLVKDWFGFFRYNSCHDCVAPTFPRLVGQRFPFPRGPRPREPGSPSAIAGSARATTSPSIDCPAQAVLGCVANVLVRVDQAAHLGHS